MFRKRSVSVVSLLFVLAACGEGGGEPPAHPANGPLYAVSSVVFSDDGNTTYVSLLDSLDAQTIDYGRALEVEGWGDIWVYEGSLFVSAGESPTITRYAIGVHGELLEQGTVSFAQYGIMKAPFSATQIMSPTKAYLLVGTDYFVVWNPTTMTIEGTLDLPTFPERDGLRLRHGTMNRSTVVRDGKMINTFYWSDVDYVRFAPDSRIYVVDIATDTVETVHEVSCPALDIGSRDAAGNVTFSNWTAADIAHLVLDEPEVCMIHIAAGEETPSEPDYFRTYTDGRVGAAARYASDRELLISVVEDDLIDIGPDTSIDDVIGSLIYTLHRLDLDTGISTEVQGIPLNAGSFYTYPIDERSYLLIPSTDYAATAIHALEGTTATEPLIQLNGWGTRLFRIR